MTGCAVLLWFALVILSRLFGVYCCFGVGLVDGCVVMFALCCGGVLCYG